MPLLRFVFWAVHCFCVGLWAADGGRVGCLLDSLECKLKCLVDGQIAEFGFRSVCGGAGPCTVIVPRCFGVLLDVSDPLATSETRRHVVQAALSRVVKFLGRQWPEWNWWRWRRLFIR